VWYVNINCFNGKFKWEFMVLNCVWENKNEKCFHIYMTDVVTN
jgi:hypothetical protein